MSEYLFIGGPADGLRIHLPSERVALHESYTVLDHIDSTDEPKRTEYYPQRIWVSRNECVTVFYPERVVDPFLLLQKLANAYLGSRERIDHSYETGRKDELESLVNWFGEWNRLPLALRMFAKASEEAAFKRRCLRLEKPDYRDDSPSGMCPNARDLKP